MVLLDEQQVEKVRALINQQLPLEEALAEDMLDHFCCSIETNMATGFDFNESIQKAFKAIAPAGLNEIEEERNLLFKIKPQILMKRIFYIGTFITTFSLSFSLLARHWHWQAGDTVMMLMGFLSLLILIIPTVGIMSYRNRKILNKADFFRILTGFMAGIGISTGMIFKVLHYPMANMLFSYGMLILIFVFLPLFFIQMYKRSYISSI
ncbi:hypothetical protein JKA74_17870 [Marivirga sp. S37H4]|uniref:Uncharacterized protein n=1 Tax=Marivirga aurantiaca TaxID=2802615 RepID=A0A934X1T9_9BACT|nr:hypothetical protein [Marivirga aurantiaca]MBK6266916.1 hypothetical protein [Marivirga aurantiaca]